MKIKKSGFEIAFEGTVFTKRVKYLLIVLIGISVVLGMFVLLKGNNQTLTYNGFDERIDTITPNSNQATTPEWAKQENNPHVETPVQSTVSNSSSAVLVDPVTPIISIMLPVMLVAMILGVLLQFMSGDRFRD